MEHKFRNKITLDIRVLTDCQKKIDKTRFYKLFKMLSQSISADNLHPESMDEHDKYFESRTEAEKDLWNSCRDLAKNDMINFIKSTNGGKKSAEIRKQKKEEEQAVISKTEKNTELAQKPVKGAFISPTLEEVLEYAREQSSFAGCGGFACTPEQAEEFWSYYESQKWRIGNETNTPIRDWKPKLRQWCVKAKQDSMKQAIKTLKQPTVLNLSARERQDLINKQKTEMLLKQLHAQEN